MVARLARDDINSPGFDGWLFHVRVLEANFELAAYELLRSEPNLLSSRLLYHHTPVQQVVSRLDLCQDIAGYRLCLFERAERANNGW